MQISINNVSILTKNKNNNKQISFKSLSFENLNNKYITIKDVLKKQNLKFIKIQLNQ